MRRHASSVLFFGLPLIGLLSCGPGTIEPVTHERCGSALLSAAEDVREIVLRDLIRNHPYRSPRRLTTYYIGVDGSSFPLDEALGWDPSPDLLHRFRDNPTQVRPISEFYALGSDSQSGPAEAGSRIIFSVSSMCWLSNSEVEVQAVV